MKREEISKMLPQPPAKRMKLSKENGKDKRSEKSGKDKFSKADNGEKKFDFKKGKKPAPFKNNKQQNGPSLLSTEKPDWNKFKKEKKELKEKRKSQRLENVYDIAVKAKKIGEKLRRADCNKIEKKELSEELYKMFEGNFEKLIFTHDMSRIIQWLLKFCSQEMRQSILTELKPKIVEIFHSKYAKNCIKKMLKYGTENMRQEILLGCNGHIVELVSNVVSAPLIDSAYKTWATEETKCNLKQEFYGGMYKNSKDNNIKTLSDVYKTAPDMKSATLSAVKINLVRILNKSIVDNAMVQAVLVEFLLECSVEDRSEIIEMLKSSILELSNSKDGAQVAMMCIWHGTTKDRKSSLKSIKEHVKDIANSEHGHAILIACFDSIDDTILMKKILFPEIVSNIKDIVVNEHGRKVILYLVARRSLTHFHPALIQQLQQGDNNATSKKPADIREKELLDAISSQLLSAIAEDASFWLANGSIAMVTLAIIKSVGEKQVEDLEKVFKAIAKLLTTNPKVKLLDNQVEYNILEHPGLHMMLKKLLQADKNNSNKEDKKIEATLGKELLAQFDNQEIKQWLNINRACFLLVLMLENEPESVRTSLISKLAPHKTLIKSKKGTGASVLLKKIQ